MSQNGKKPPEKGKEKAKSPQGGSQGTPSGSSRPSTSRDSLSVINEPTSPYYYDHLGRRVDVYGQPVDQFGRPIQERPVDRFGRPLDEWGRPVDRFGRPLDAWGRPVDRFGRPLDAWGRPVDRFGRPLDEWGRPVDQFGRLLDEWGRPVDRFGRPLDAWGRPVDRFGRPLDEWGRPVDQFGRPLDEWGRPIDQLRPSLNQWTRPGEPPRIVLGQVEPQPSTSGRDQRSRPGEPPRIFLGQDEPQPSTSARDQQGKPVEPPKKVLEADEPQPSTSGRDQRGKPVELPKKVLKADEPQPSTSGRDRRGKPVEPPKKVLEADESQPSTSGRDRRGKPVELPKKVLEADEPQPSTSGRDQRGKPVELPKKVLEADEPQPSTSGRDRRGKPVEPPKKVLEADEPQPSTSGRDQRGKPVEPPKKVLEADEPQPSTSGRDRRGKPVEPPKKVLKADEPQPSTSGRDRRGKPIELPKKVLEADKPQPSTSGLDQRGKPVEPPKKVLEADEPQPSTSGRDQRGKPVEPPKKVLEADEPQPSTSGRDQRGKLVEPPKKVLKVDEPQPSTSGLKSRTSSYQHGAIPKQGTSANFRVPQTFSSSSSEDDLPYIPQYLRFGSDVGAHRTPDGFLGGWQSRYGIRPGYEYQQYEHQPYGSYFTYNESNQNFNNAYYPFETQPGRSGRMNRGPTSSYSRIPSLFLETGPQHSTTRNTEAWNPFAAYPNMGAHQQMPRNYRLYNAMAQPRQPGTEDWHTFGPIVTYSQRPAFDPQHLGYGYLHAQVDRSRFGDNFEGRLGSFRTYSNPLHDNPFYRPPLLDIFGFTPQFAPRARLPRPPSRDMFETIRRRAMVPEEEIREVMMRQQELIRRLWEVGAPVLDGRVPPVDPGVGQGDVYGVHNDDEPEVTPRANIGQGDTEDPVRDPSEANLLLDEEEESEQEDLDDDEIPLGINFPGPVNERLYYNDAAGDQEDEDVIIHLPPPLGRYPREDNPHRPNDNFFLLYDNDRDIWQDRPVRHNDWPETFSGIQPNHISNYSMPNLRAAMNNIRGYAPYYDQHRTEDLTAARKKSKEAAEREKKAQMASTSRFVRDSEDESSEES